MTLGDPNDCSILDLRRYRPTFPTISEQPKEEHGNTKLIRALSHTLSPESERLTTSYRRPGLITQTNSHTSPESGDLTEFPQRTELAVQGRRNELLTAGIVAAMVLAVAVFYTCCQISGLLIDRCRRKAVDTDLTTLRSDEAMMGTQNASFTKNQPPPPRKLRSGKNNQFRKNLDSKCVKKFHWPRRN